MKNAAHPMDRTTNRCIGGGWSELVATNAPVEDEPVQPICE